MIPSLENTNSDHNQQLPIPPPSSLFGHCIIELNNGTSSLFNTSSSDSYSHLYHFNPHIDWTYFPVKVKESKKLNSSSENENEKENTNTIISNNKGRYLEATRDIQPGELIFTESAFQNVVAGESLLNCIYCFKKQQLPSGGWSCQTCQVVKYCNQDCEEKGYPIHKLECKLLKKWGSSILAECWDFTVFMLLLRLCLARYKGIVENNLFKMNTSTPHSSSSSSTYSNFNDIFSLYSFHSIMTNLMEKYQNDCSLLLNLLPDPMRPSLEELQKFIGIIHINSFGLRHGGSGVFYLASFINHGISNVCHFHDKGVLMQIRATRFIKKGEELLFSYLDEDYEPVYTRQSVLWSQRCFLCSCERCLDKTEGERHIASYKCRHCQIGWIAPSILINQSTSHKGDGNFMFIPKNPQHVEWSCSHCSIIDESRGFDENKANTICENMLFKASFAFTSPKRTYQSKENKQDNGEEDDEEETGVDKDRLWKISQEISDVINELSDSMEMHENHHVLHKLRVQELELLVESANLYEKDSQMKLAQSIRTSAILCVEKIIQSLQIVYRGTHNPDKGYFYEIAGNLYSHLNQLELAQKWMNLAWIEYKCCYGESSELSLRVKPRYCNKEN